MLTHNISIYYEACRVTLPPVRRPGTYEQDETRQATWQGTLDMTTSDMDHIQYQYHLHSNIMYVVTISLVRLTLALIGILYIIIMDPKMLLLGTLGNFVQNFLPGRVKLYDDNSVG